ncbi:probable methyltransferase-like protein 25 isoform X2 [Pleurodeles waltl]|uniref:probable methyltransferase-like protein 25 isoform X2 n=1 Tax=Pleurodeles waltl TaxID=8319 RepID=UPI003709BAE2
MSCNRRQLSTMEQPAWELLRQRLRAVRNFLSVALPIANAHTGDFYTRGVWDELVCSSPEAVLAAFTRHHPPEQLNHTEPTRSWDENELLKIFCKASHRLVDLESFLEAAKHHSLPYLGVCTPLGQLLGFLNEEEHNNYDKKITTDEFMNYKKAHEVLVMSQLIDSIANYCGIKQDSIMVGLHTCGDLSPNTLRIFVGKPEIKAVCSVGCCYHLLSEEFEVQPEENTVEKWGFPMCQDLKEERWSCGRNARMSACLALDRVAVGQGLPLESLFYRAVLQVIVKECYGNVKSDRRVGKAFSKSSCFLDYCRESLKNLGLDESKLSDSRLIEYYEMYKSRKKELEAFNMLRVVLSPCIEALILLDRLCYLREQGNVAWSGLVKLFDPVKSPRCYAVIAVKKY